MFSGLPRKTVCEETGSVLSQDNGFQREISVPVYAVPGLLEAVKLAYRKHHLDDDMVGWSELSDKLCNALCNAMGDAGFQIWLEIQGKSPGGAEVSSIAPVGSQYRLLTAGDIIESSDEFLSDDCETWVSAHDQVMAGRNIKYDASRDVPMRRKCHDSGNQQTMPGDGDSASCDSGMLNLEPEYTAGICKVGGVDSYVVGKLGTTEILAITGQVGDSEYGEKSKSDAIRIAAIWNACRGTSIESILKHGLATPSQTPANGAGDAGAEAGELCCPDPTPLLSVLAGREPTAEDQLNLLRVATAAAVCGLYENYKEDVLARFTIEELQAVVDMTAAFRDFTVEHIYHVALFGR
ncbi:hypothetical protein FY034_18900 (plasmid) [Trichlorobacter lovleyi]|uniref:hypothetical protein n=1 Tax=Trichlorobacter lovleyi TaxID=313985 RepID=UPI00223FA1ED|nr:hypothetical protein [Trichlorobacter lovleyi]QOX81046.1 hypothetical protein FY034_18900 [Trichlorobacter lovleyi]